MTPDEKTALRAEILSGPLAAELAPAVAAGDFATIQAALHDKGRGDTLPVVTVDPILKRIACDLTRYHLHGQLAPDHVVKRAEQAKADLRAIAKGELKIDDGTGTQAMTADPPEYAAPERTFTADSLTDY